ncbi:MULTISPECIES: 6-phosphofructokinase II [Kosakonia]|uniref:6-phosphofructokinase II n=1 Tax=Kosakonia TaxID=1330547 RepID=UPI0009A8F81E|nr:MULTISPECIES: 6-phosphofructokinase II [Kosakonia]NCF03905.1 6-phosphofructokinase II [Kosakonia sp. MH5]SKC22374.1 6-phosphofructokinase [Kosakonia radicincitans]
MVAIYTLTLAPSLDSATLTPQIYPEGKLRCTSPVFEPGGGGINVARAITHLGGKATAIFPAGGATGEHLTALLADENVPTISVDANDWTRQNLHVHVESSGEQYRFVMPGASLSEDEFRQIEEKVLTIEPGALLVVSGSLPPGITIGKLTQLIKTAQQHGLRCIVDSSGEALSAALAIGNIELVKPNQKELSALVGRELTQPDDVRKAAQEIVDSGKALRVVVSLGPQGALAVDANQCVQVVPPPMKSQSTVGAGDSMVGAMTLKLAHDAPLDDMVRYGVAAGSAATINHGTRLCALADTQKIYDYLRNA